MQAYGCLHSQAHVFKFVFFFKSQTCLVDQACALKKKPKNV